MNDIIKDKLKIDNQLLSNIKMKIPDLKKLLKEIGSHWTYEDLIYRFYHNSFKVYAIQSVTKKIVDVLNSIAPTGCHFCPEFKEIIDSGASGKLFKYSHNRNWTKHTRVFLEAFFHSLGK